MPQGNGTGPVGAGPMTGRGAGYCARNQAPQPGAQRRLGHNRKSRNMRQNQAAPTPTTAEVQLLHEKVDAMLTELRTLEQQLQSIAGTIQD